MKKLILAAVAYGLIALATFGHSASAKPTACVPSDKYCSEALLTGDAATGAFLAALFWPLYWSWELQS